MERRWEDSEAGLFYGPMINLHFGFLTPGDEELASLTWEAYTL